MGEDDEEAPPQPVWEGSYDEDGLPHGKGTMKYPPPPVGEDEEEKPGDSFEGTMEHGQRSGIGKYTWSNGAVYEGPYLNGKKNGKGKWTFPDKGVYEGDFVDDNMEGNGFMTYANGDIYMGQFVASKRHGNGMYNFKESRSQLIGEWSEGVFLKGRWAYQDGSLFTGDFVNSAPSEGTYYFSASQLMQSGKVVDGRWQGGEWTLGTVEQLMAA